MEELVLFVHHQGSKKMAEITVIEAMTVAELLGHGAVRNARGTDGPDEYLVFFGESEAPAPRQALVKHCHAGHLGRVHLTKCIRVNVTVYYTHLTHSKEFAPGTRLKAVKDWAVAETQTADKATNVRMRKRLISRKIITSNRRILA